MDLDKIKAAIAHLSRPHSMFSDKSLGHVVALCNAAPAMIDEIDTLRARLAVMSEELELLRADKTAYLKYLVENPSSAAARLAEAKRLGLEAIKLVVGAMDNAPGHTGEPGDESAMAAGYRCADELRTALEGL